MQKKVFLIQTLLYHCLIHINHCVEIRVVHLDPFRDGVNHILIGNGIIIGDYDVKMRFVWVSPLTMRKSCMLSFGSI